MDGYFIAKIEVQKLENSLKGIFYKRLPNNRNSTMIIDQLSNNQLLKVVLIQSENQNIQSQIFRINASHVLFETIFSKEKLNQFLEESGDKNFIHFGENPVVPGVMILDFYLKNINTVPHFFTIKFQNPLFLQNHLQVCKIAENEVVGIANDQQIFQIAIN